MKLSKIKPDDAESFRSAMQAVRPLKADDRHRVTTQRALPAPFKQIAAQIPAIAAFGSTESSSRMLVADAISELKPLLREGLPRKVLRQLGSRDCPIADSFDLHGMNEKTAARALQRFLAASLQHDLPCIRVVHGKGLRSEGPAVLKLMSWQLLWQHSEVLALKPCSPKDGGTGAVLALLKTTRKSAS